MLRAILVFLSVTVRGSAESHFNVSVTVHKVTTICGS